MSATYQASHIKRTRSTKAEVERRRLELRAIVEAMRPMTVRRPRDRNAEAQIQASIVQWIRLVAPELLVFHVPNGGYRTPAEAARMKWIGVLAGIPDLVLLGRNGKTWLIEVKAASGSLSAEQRAIRDAAVALRIPYAIARSIDDVRQAFRIWEIPTREVKR